ncbi:dolichyl pyrophosphate Glc1Man9GlcNAc2 alpha-1,3-glucosyltransferase isoform X2 [Hydra vulgaris]|uniref:Alpha-1,3-glucosyltransferase n=1 Tax=Hydra vulgaris TaxID=6087 RepID=A0ABM4D2N7_HYDVU
MVMEPCGTGTDFTIPIIFISSVLKLMTLDAYHSTDFEVHRNWLAITSNLQISEWYFEKTSEWTLDYPPFFAWFEYVLSFLAVYFDPKMLVIENLNYVSKKAVFFQRFSVVVCDLFLFYALKRYCKLCLTRIESVNKTKEESLFIVLGVLMNAGLFMVDHIHFQYNGFLFGFLILSILEMKQGRFLHSAFWFTILLNLKHIYVYVAPVYFVYLLRNFCFNENNRLKSQSYICSLIGVSPKDFSIKHLIQLGLVVLAIFGISFGPFIYMGQITQVLSRLFPVKRGLLHAYWACNFWSLYSGLDKIASIIGSYLGLNVGSKPASLTGGLVTQQSFSMLPDIPLVVTFIFTVITILPCLIKIWFRPNEKNLFLPCLILCAYASFIFGYHVHEKAILMVTIPMTLLSTKSEEYARVFTILSITANFSIFPLLYKEAETPLKLSLFLLYTFLSTYCLYHFYGQKSTVPGLGIPFIKRYEAFYLYGYIPLFIYCNIGHNMIDWNGKLPFLPLMLTSLYCSIGVIWSWLLMYVKFIIES